MTKALAYSFVVAVAVLQISSPVEGFTQSSRSRTSRSFRSISSNTNRFFGSLYAAESGSLPDIVNSLNDGGATFGRLEDKLSSQGTSSVDDFLTAARAKYQATGGGGASPDASFVTSAVEGHADKAPLLADQLMASATSVNSGFGDFATSTNLAAAVTDTATTAATEGKVPSMVDFLRDAAIGQSTAAYNSAASGSLLTDAKAQMTMILENGQDLFAGSHNAAVTATPTSNFATSAAFQSMSVEAARSLQTITWQTSGGWIVAGCALVAIAGQKQAGIAEGQRKAAEGLQKQAMAVLELAEDMQSMSNEIKRLNAETVTLRNELRDAENDLQVQNVTVIRERRKLAQRLVFARQRVLRMKAKEMRTGERAARLQCKLQDRKSEKEDYVQELASTTRRVKDQIKAMQKEKHTAAVTMMEAQRAMQHQQAELSQEEPSEMMMEEPVMNTGPSVRPLLAKAYYLEDRTYENQTTPSDGRVSSSADPHYAYVK